MTDEPTDWRPEDVPGVAAGWCATCSRHAPVARCRVLLPEGCEAVTKEVRLCRPCWGLLAGPDQE